MKRAIQVNIHDRIFFIDEDAYQLLQNYLHQLSQAFPDEEGQEIVSDIETRVSELFEERTRNGKNVIDLIYVNEVIDIVGRPEELNDGAHEGEAVPPFNGCAGQEPEKKVKKLYRDVDNKMLGGVISGLSIYLGWNVTIMRILLVLVCVTTYFFPIVICYLICWMVIPPADTPRRRMEMLGQEVTVDNIGQNIKNKTHQNPKKPDTETISSVLGSILNVSFKIIMGIIGLVAAMACMGLLIALLFVLFFVGGFAFVGVEGLGSMMDITVTGFTFWQCLWSILSIVASLLVMGGLFWMAGSAIFNWKSASKSAIISSLIIFLICVAGMAVLTFYLVHNNSYLIPFVS